MKTNIQHQPAAVSCALPESTVNTISAAYSLLREVAGDNVQIQSALACLEAALTPSSSGRSSVASSLLFCLYEGGAFSVAASGDTGALHGYLRDLGRSLWPAVESKQATDGIGPITVRDVYNRNGGPVVSKRKRTNPLAR
ncbi:hypothetical protein [Paludibacterium yongneupense]|uniref:hypothetical protein n=1 Tax=Paludibacterium yongneupense TaxID=400061 RepID=UPI00048C38C4|nr:hypothetical protein [Paludibacterium yongneupense]